MSMFQETMNHGHRWWEPNSSFHSIGMFLTITFVTRINVQTLKSQGVDKKLDPQHGKT